jgi:hypothetical protein
MITVRCIKVFLATNQQYRWPNGFISFERRSYDSSEHLKPKGDHDERGCLVDQSY